MSLLLLLKIKLPRRYFCLIGTEWCFVSCDKTISVSVVKMWSKKVFVFLLPQLVCSNFVAQYFSEIRPVKTVIVRTCLDSFKILQELSRSNISVKTEMVQRPTESSGVFGVFMDCQNCFCAFENTFSFNSSFYWLIMGNREILDKIKGVRIDSRITLLEETSIGYKAFDVYSYGNLPENRCLKVKPIGFVRHNGTFWVDKLPGLYFKEYRGNLNGFALRTAIPVIPFFKHIFENFLKFLLVCNFIFFFYLKFNHI